MAGPPLLQSVYADGKESQIGRIMTVSTPPPNKGEAACTADPGRAEAPTKGGHKRAPPLFARWHTSDGKAGQRPRSHKFTAVITTAHSEHSDCVAQQDPAEFPTHSAKDLSDGPHLGTAEALLPPSPGHSNQRP